MFWSTLQMKYCPETGDTMARSKKGKLFQLFKNDFKITFYYKPTMLDDDVFHYIILDDLVKLKIKVIHGTLVIDDIIPLSTTYLAKIYDELIELFTKQIDFTVLVSLTGNTSAFASACIKVNAPIVDDPRFICIPKNLYDKLKEYYKGDESKYGFYLLAIREIEENEVIEETSIEAGKVPLIDKIMTKFEEKYKTQFKIVAEYDNWKLGKIISINGIQFKITFDESTKTVGLYNFNIYEMKSYFDLIDICNVLEEYSKRGSIIIYDVESPQLNDICVSKGYKNLSESNDPKMLSFNQRYTSKTFGTYKIERNLF